MGTYGYIEYKFVQKKATSFSRGKWKQICDINKFIQIWWTKFSQA